MKDWDFREDLLPLKDKIFRLALRIVASRAEAEDITQETLLRLWKKRAELPEIDSVEAYALTMARHLALDAVEKKDNTLLPLDEAVCPVPDATPSTPERMAADERRAWVGRLVSRLPEKQRTVMHLRDVEGRSYREIAAVMGIGESDVKVTLFRARQWVRNEYEKIERYGL